MTQLNTLNYLRFYLITRENNIDKSQTKHQISAIDLLEVKIMNKLY